MNSNTTNGSSPNPNQTLPVKNHTKPFWRTEPSELDRLQSTPELPHESDIVIIGAGYAGISTAYHLLKGRENDQNQVQGKPYVTILEAREICSGASGRNGE